MPENEQDIKDSGRASRSGGSGGGGGQRLTLQEDHDPL